MLSLGRIEVAWPGRRKMDDDASRANNTLRYRGPGLLEQGIQGTCLGKYS